MIDTKQRSSIRGLSVTVAALVFAAALGGQTAATSTEQKSAATSAQAQAVQTQEWKTYSYPADGFSVSLPLEPMMQKKDVPTEKGSFEMHAYLVQETESALVVMACNYGDAITGREVDSVLRGAQEGAISNVGGHFIREKAITLGTYHGIEFEAENDSTHFTARIFLAGSTLYQTLIASPLDKPYASTARFLDSFQLIARVKN
jgi:glucose/arabinose dehydrogenase